MKKNQTVFNLRVLLLATCIPIFIFSSVESAGAWQDSLDSDLSRVMTDGMGGMMGLQQRPVSPLEKQIGYLKKARTDEQKETVKKRIRNVLSQQYDTYLNASAGELAKLESRLEKLREKLEARKQAKEKLIEIELQRLANEAEGLVWPTKKNANTGPRSSAYTESRMGFEKPDFQNSTYRGYSAVSNGWQNQNQSVRDIELVKRGFRAPRTQDQRRPATFDRDRFYQPAKVNDGSPSVARSPSEDTLLVSVSDDEAKTKNDLRQIGVGCLNFESVNQHFPMNIEDEIGTPHLSWRVAILPFIGEEELYKKFHLDEPWDSPHNKKLLAEMPSIYSCNRSDHKTNRLGIADQGGIFEPSMRMGFAAITDGSSNTILCVATTGDENVRFWTEPSDLTIDEFIKDATLLGSINIGICDGAVVNLSDDVSSEELRHLATRNDGQVVRAHVGTQ